MTSARKITSSQPKVLHSQTIVDLLSGLLIVGRLLRRVATEPDRSRPLLLAEVLQAAAPVDADGHPAVLAALEPLLRGAGLELAAGPLGRAAVVRLVGAVVEVGREPPLDQ